MADTEKTTSELQTLLANNASGAISPQDLRDFMASTMGGYASMILTIAGSPATPQGLTTSDQIITAYNAVSAQSSDLFTNGCSASAATGKITIGQTGYYLVSFFTSSRVDDNNKVVHFTPYIDDAIGLVEVDRKFGTANDVGSIAMNAIVPYTAGAVVDIRVRVESGTTNITYEALGFHLHRVG
jgi:hypothetical protein